VYVKGGMYHGGAVSATPTSVGAADALGTAAVILPAGDPERPGWACSRSSLGGDGELPSVVSRPLINGGGAIRCLSVQTDQHLRYWSS